MLQPIPIARFHPHRRVQREPIHIRAQRPLHERFVLRPAANPLVPFPGPFAERRAALHRRGGEFDQQLVVTSSVRPIDPFLRLAMLRAEFEELGDAGFDLALTGFDGAEIAALQVPDFAPATEDEQGKLDELEPKWIACPHCGKEFDAREHGQG